MRSLRLRKYLLVAAALLVVVGHAFAPTRGSRGRAVLLLRAQQSSAASAKKILQQSSRASLSSLRMTLSEEESSGTSSSNSLVSSPLDRPLLAGLDLVSLTAFAAIGKASHAPDGSLDLAAVAVTAAPFVAAWFATAPLTGVYQRLDDDTQKPNSKNVEDVALASAVQTAKGWALAVPLGCALRGVIKGYVPPLPFVIVTLIATLVILGGTRALYAVAEDKLSS